MPYEIENKNKEIGAICGNQIHNIVFKNIMHSLQDNPYFATTDNNHSTQINHEYLNVYRRVSIPL